MAEKLHKMREDVLKLIGFNKPMTFTEIQKALKLSISRYLAYHTNSLVKSGYIEMIDKKYYLKSLPKNKQGYKYLEVVRNGKVIERISIVGFTPFEIEDKITKVRTNIPSVYFINQVKYICRAKVGFFTENLS